TSPPRSFTGNPVSSRQSVSDTPESPTPIRTRRRSACWLCGTGGELLFEDLYDHLFGVQGRWSLRQCTNTVCRMVWLDPVAIEEDIGHLYRRYYTHATTAGRHGPRERIHDAVRSGYLQSKLGYARGVGRRWYRYLHLLAHVYPTGPHNIASTAMFLPA